MNRKMKRMILSLLLSIFLIIGNTVGVAAGAADVHHFSVGQTLSGTVACDGMVYYQFSLSGQKTITLNVTLNERHFSWDIKDYNDKIYADSEAKGNYDYNTLTDLYSTTGSVTLSKGTYYLVVKHDPSGPSDVQPVTYSIKTVLQEAGQVSGTPGTINIGIRLKKGKSIQLTSILSGMSGKTKWKSSKKSVAKVSSKGKVTARKKGTATITASCKGKKAKIKVKVYK